MHPTLVPLLTEDRHRQNCLCGAASEHPYGLCRKCHARMTWRRRTADTARRAARRQRRGQSARERALMLALAASMVRANRAGR
jgi:hypothetical protein